MIDFPDFSSPHDGADEARAEEPPDDYGQRPPLDLDDLQKLYDLAEEPGGLPAWGRIVYLRVPELIAELGQARERIAEWEALPTCEDWVVTPGPDVPPRDGHARYTPDAALSRAASGDGQAWRRVVVDGPVVIREWEPIANEPPF